MFNSPIRYRASSQSGVFLHAAYKAVVKLISPPSFHHQASESVAQVVFANWDLSLCLATWLAFELLFAVGKDLAYSLRLLHYQRDLSLFISLVQVG
jgi:hypothetical protein